MKYLLVLIFLSGVELISQEIQATVNINDEAIRQEDRINIQSLAVDLENYINNTRFTELEWEGPKIPVDISIAISGGGQNGIFSAQLLFTSKRYLDGTDDESTNVMRMIDKTWTFQYQRGAIHAYNPLRFNTFTTLIDFYMLLVIGSDLDTFGELDGSDVFNLAKQVCLLGANNNSAGWETFAQPGEFTRFNLVSELTDVRYEEFRMLIFELFVDGLDMMAFDKDQAIENIKSTISKMADFKQNKLSTASVLFQAFFDAKAAELAQTFKGSDDEQVFKDLKYLDPSHTMLYQDAQDF